MKKLHKLCAAVTVVLLTAYASVSISAARPADVKQLKKDIQIIVKTMNTKNDKLNLKYTWPEIIEIAGGKEKVLEAIKQIRKNDEGNNYKYKDIKFHKSIEFYRAGKKRFAVIPFLMTIKQTGKLNRITKAEFFYLGIKDSRKAKWTYLDGTMFFMLNIREFVDDFPTEVDFPRTRIISQKTIQTDNKK